MKKTSKASGFTLVELAVVVVIIGVLASFGVPRFLDAVERSKASEAFGYLSSLRAAQERYIARQGEYASTLSPKEQDLVSSIKTKTAAVIQSILADSVNRKKLLAAVGDGTLGLYVSADQQVFVNAKFVRFMEESMRGNMQLHLSPDLLVKLDSADADALLKAPDYKDRAVALRLRAVV